MLPITTRRSFHVPHTLAMVAALAALIAAFGWSADEGTPDAEHARVEQIIEADPESTDDAGRAHVDSGAAGSDSRPCSLVRGCVQDQPSILFPLVLPSR